MARVAEAVARDRDANGDGNGAREARLNCGAKWSRVTELHPTSPWDHLAAARAWLAVWNDSGNPDAASRAGAHARRCEEIDATRPAGNAMKLRAAERAILQGIHDALTSDSSDSPESRPAR
jgi:hypothetical protein